MKILAVPRCGQCFLKEIHAALLGRSCFVKKTIGFSSWQWLLVTHVTKLSLGELVHGQQHNSWKRWYQDLARLPSGFPLNWSWAASAPHGAVPGAVAQPSAP